VARYGGTTEDITILDNIMVTTVDSRAYDYTTIGSFPAKHVERLQPVCAAQRRLRPGSRFAPNGTTTR
jgi:hypothetical protein